MGPSVQTRKHSPLKWKTSLWTATHPNVDCDLVLAKGGVHAFQWVHPEAEISVPFWASLFAFARRTLNLT